MSDRHRAEIDAIIADISDLQRGLPFSGYQAEDREAFEIVRRIERKLKGVERTKPREAAE